MHGPFLGDHVKNDLRRKFRALRRDFVGHAKEDLRKTICNSLKSNLNYRAHSFWAIYKCLPFEADPSLFVEQTSDQIKWCYPKVSEGNLRFLHPNANAPWVVNSHGIWEPLAEDSIEVDLSQIEGIILPGVAFDLFGGRLGSGKGYYDRTLGSYSGAKVGLAFEVQISSQPLPHETHDISIDSIISETGIYQVKERNIKHG